MIEKIIILSPYKELMQEIESIPYYWAEQPIEDHPLLPQFNRKLVISGFNSPDLENERDKRLYITIKQIFTDKSTGKVYMMKNAPLWTVYAHTWSYVRNISDPTKLAPEVEKQTLNDEGEIVKTEKVKLTTGTIDYLKYHLLNRKAHLIDLFYMYLLDFYNSQKEELNKL